MQEVEWAAKIKCPSAHKYINPPLDVALKIPSEHLYTKSASKLNIYIKGKGVSTVSYISNIYVPVANG